MPNAISVTTRPYVFPPDSSPSPESKDDREKSETKYSLQMPTKANAGTAFCHFLKIMRSGTIEKIPY